MAQAQSRFHDSIKKTMRVLPVACRTTMSPPAPAPKEAAKAAPKADAAKGHAAPAADKKAAAPGAKAPGGKH
jgi:hypothetical protein